MAELRIDQVKGIKEPIQYIRIVDKKIKGYKYSDVLHGLLRYAISANRTECLEAARIIYFNEKNFSNTYEYLGWYYTIPKRKVEQVDKIIKILNLTGLGVDTIHVQFVEDDLSAGELQSIAEAERIQRKIQSEETKYYQPIKSCKAEISDEELKQRIFEDCAFGMRFGEPFDYQQYERRIGNLSREREQYRQTIIHEQEFNRRRILDDDRQARIFGCSVEEYRAKYKEANILENIYYESTVFRKNYAIEFEA